MKKNLLIMSLAAIMSLSLVACSENITINSAPNPSTSADSTTSEDEPSNTPSIDVTSDATSDNPTSNDVTSEGTSDNPTSNDVTSDTTSNTPSTSEGTSDNPTSNTPSTSEGTSITPSTPSTNPNTEIYGVVVIPTQHITITANVNVAHPGDSITLSVKVDDGYLLDGIYVNDQKLTGYEFVMPNTSALITSKVSSLSLEGMFLGGDISEPLKLNQETGIWEAKGVKVAMKSNVYYSINGKELDATHIDNSKCFADLDTTGSSREKGIYVAGGATYDFYYDPSNPATPCYVVRTSVDQLPNSIDTLRTIFDGFVKSESTENPKNVNHVEFSSTKDNESYVWDLYENGSYAQVNRISPNREKAIVYKSIENGVYTIVDSYTEGESTQDMSTRDDVTKYSAHYDMVQALDPVVGAKHYQKLESQANLEARQFSHNYDSLQYDIEYAYSWGHGNDVADDIYDWEVKVVSDAQEDGSFITTVNSWTSVVSYGSISNVDKNHHNVYEMTIHFAKDGSLLDLNYYEKEYNDKQFNFGPITSGGHGSFLPGGEDDPANEYEITAKYRYGEAKPGNPTVDVSKYFVSEITECNFTSSSGKAGELDRKDQLTRNSFQYESEFTKNVEMKYEPSTALDAWQYGVNSSSNTNVVSRYGQLNDLWTAVGQGETNITIGNRTKNTGVTATFKLTVPENLGDVKQVYCHSSVYPYVNDNFVANSGTIAAGTKDSVKMAAVLKSGQYDYYPDIKIISPSPLLVVTYDKTTGYMTVDATPAKAITEKQSVRLEIEANYYDGWGPSYVYMTITPTTKLIDSVVGEWQYAYDEGETAETTGYIAQIKFSDTEVDVNGSKFKQGTVHVETTNSKGVKNIYDISFLYVFDASSQKFTYVKATSAKMNGSAVTGNVTFLLAIDNVNGYLDAYAEFGTGMSYDQEYGDYIPSSVIFIGSYVEQDEGDTIYYYDPFELVTSK